MDDAERRLRESLASAVDGWTPDPMPPVRRSSPRLTPLRVGLAAAAVVFLGVGGTVLGLHLQGSTGKQFLVAGPTASSAAPMPSDCPSEVTTAQSTVCLSTDSPADPASDLPSTPGVTVSPAVAISSLAASSSPSLAGAPSPSLILPTVSLDLTPRAVVSSAATTCTAADVKLSVTTDKATYIHADEVKITTSLAVNHTCVLKGSSSISEKAQDGSFSYGPCGSEVDNFANGPLNCSKPIVENRLVTSGDVETNVDSHWYMHVTEGEGEIAETYAPIQPGGTGYDVTYTVGNLMASTPIMIVPAPACGGSTIKAFITLDKSQYSPGDTMTMMTRTQNQGPATCEFSTANRLAFPTATDSSGAAVWRSGLTAGSNYPSTCACPTRAAVLWPVVPDEYYPPVVETGGPTSYEQIFSWTLVADGTAANPQAAPLPAGSYTMSWSGDYGEATPVSVPFTITGASQTPGPSATPSQA